VDGSISEGLLEGAKHYGGICGRHRLTAQTAHRQEDEEALRGKDKEDRSAFSL
jgi:hypothetical protein